MSKSPTDALSQSADELRLLATMLRTLRDKLTPRQVDDIADRIDGVMNDVASAWERMAHFTQPPGQLQSPGLYRRAGGASSMRFSRNAGTAVLDPNVSSSISRSLTLKPLEPAPGTLTAQPPHSSTKVARSPATSRPDGSGRNAVPRGWTVKAAPTITSVERRAEGPAQLPAHQLAFNARHALELQETTQASTASLYLTLRSCAQALRAESVAVFVTYRGEMVCCCSVGPKNTFPPSTVRHSCGGSPTFSVLTTSVAVHRTLRDPTNATNVQDTVIMPVLRPQSTATAFPLITSGSDGNHCRAVLQVTNKNRGTCAFTEADESRAAMYATVVSHVMAMGDVAGVDWTTTAYDPVALLQLAPFTAAAPLPSLGDAIDATRKTRETLAFESFEMPRMIHRSVTDMNVKRMGRSGTLADALLRNASSSGLPTAGAASVGTAGSALARRAMLGDAAEELGPAPSLREIDSYVCSLRECWRRSVDETATTVAEASTRTHQMRELRSELEEVRGRASQLEQALQLERLSAGDYVAHYQKLKEELDAFIEKRFAGSDDTLKWFDTPISFNQNSKSTVLDP